MKKLVSTGLGLVMSLAVAFGGAAQTHPLEGLDPVADGFNTNTVDGWFRGWEFTVNADNVTVTELGMRTPGRAENVILELWDSTTQTLIASTPATTAGNVWQYFSITPTPLTNGGTYVVGILAPGSAMYYYDNNQHGGWYPTGVIEYQTMRFHNNSTSGWPGSTLSGYQYGVADIGYIIPAPGAVALLGVAGLVAHRRRRAC